MSTPLDEDASALALVAEDAARTLHEATHPDVGYPGLERPDDVAEVLQALGSLAGGLGRTLAHLGRFLDEQLDAGLLTGPGSDTGASAVSAVRTSLVEAHGAAEALAAQLQVAARAARAAEPADG